MDRKDVNELREIMNKLIDILPQNEPEVLLLKKYRQTIDNVNAIFEIATQDLKDRKDIRDILEFFMQTEALTSQFLKNKEGK